jgi:nucleotide-binding universal stress UspA family protein
MALGSTAERVVRQAPCPVLIPRGKKFRATTWSGEPVERFALRRILVPIDFSKCSLAGLKYAAALARRFGARVRLVHVVFPYSTVFQFDRMTGDLASLVKKAKKEAERQLLKIRRSTILRDIPTESVVLSGSTVDEICAESARSDVDLVVASTHGRTGFTHVMLGSVAEHVIRYSESPVLVVPSA